jgi:hypothetical protein
MSSYVEEAYKRRGGIPVNITTESWAAFNIANEFKYSTMFKSYIC